MKFILAGWLTLGLALLWDRFLFSIGVQETVRVGILVPIGEELLKYSVSSFNDLTPPLLYAIFGFGEGVYESVHNKKRFDPILVLAGMGLHTFVSIYFLFKIPAWLSLTMAIASHLFWNKMILDRNSVNKHFLK